jgi:biotin carboxyl carrier protein
MRLEIRFGTAAATEVNVVRTGHRLQILDEGRTIEADAVEASHGVYSVLIGGQAFEVRVEETPNAIQAFIADHEFSFAIADPRAWQRRRARVLEVEGRQEIAAPMPGKIVHVLVAQGARVEAGQGLLVIEAMKMQNEIRSPKAGTVERLLVREGQAVNAGEILATIV